MSKILIATIAAVAMVSTTHAAPYMGSSSWSLSEDASSKKSKKSDASIVEQFLVLIGFDQKLPARAIFSFTTGAGSSDTTNGQTKSCSDSKPAVPNEDPVEVGGTSDQEPSGPEPILFAF